MIRTPPRPTACLLIGWLLSAATAQAQGLPTHPNKVALVVGIDRYHNRAFANSTLRYARRDATELAAVLKEQGFDVQVLAGDDATKASVEAGFVKLTSGRRHTDIVIVALAGHGFQLVRLDAAGVPKRDEEGELQEDVFFCPVDADPRDRKTLINLHDDLLRRLARRGGINLLLVDACRDSPDLAPAAPAADRAFNGNALNGRIPSNTVMMFSCSAGQRAKETAQAGGGHGVFFHHVIEGLRGRATDPGTDEVTWDSLSAYLRTNVDRRAREWFPGEAGILPEGDTLQFPHELRNLQTEVRLARIRPVFAGTAAGQSKVNSIGIALRWIPPTSQPFQMGSPADEEGRSNDEAQVPVTLTRGFWMGEREVTQAQWQRVMGTTLHQQRDKGNPEWSIKGEGSDYPMYYVNHDEAVEFARKLSLIERKAGRLPADWEYGLPTEAQWEYACRAGTTGPYSFDGGADQLGDYAWFDGNGGGETHPVGEKKPNDWGLYDMHGNVWEWCADWHADALSGGENPTGPPQASNRVLRGGNWFLGADRVRSASRANYPPAPRYYDCGFRVVVVSSQ